MNNSMRRERTYGTGFLEESEDNAAVLLTCSPIVISSYQDTMIVTTPTQLTFVERDNVGYQDDIKTATKDTGTLQKTGPLDERISINKGRKNAQLSSCK